MKKVILSVIWLLLGFCVAQAQSEVEACKAIVAPQFEDKSVLDIMPIEKLQWHCAFSHNSFYESDTIPADAVEYDIEVVSRYDNGEALPHSFVVDLTTLSYYAYNFHDFRYRHYEQPICFRTPSSSHPYLVMRTYQETLFLTNGQ
ncbi:MAG: hypothetical protein KBT04_07660 [Bacteroidales bacterium]|nr:hypothetical protein [Candidatus Colimorpha onthohippi]